MLTNIHVKNLALIDEADVSFSNGLNILSGETGAGKSILIGSINAALGGKISKDMIRKNKDYALTELTFTIKDPKMREYLSNEDIELEEDELLITRKITEGKSIFRINGETVPASRIRELTQSMIDLHGQHEHQSLLKKAKHLEILDQFAKAETAGLLSETAKYYHEYKKAEKELSSMTLDEEARMRELSFVDYEMQEIENANLARNEEEDLMAEFKLAANGKHIVNTLSDIYTNIGSDGSQSAGAKIEKAVRQMISIADFDPKLSALKDQVMDLEGLLGDFISALRDYEDHISYDETRLNEIQTRLDIIHDLKRKYGNSYDAIMEHLKKAEQRKYELEEYDIRKENLSKLVLSYKEKLDESCEKLTLSRKKAAQILEKKITSALKELHFLDVVFNIQILSKEEAGLDGKDDVEFLISTNPGESPKPLGMVASGGELSRIMLAVKAVLAEMDEIETLVFDEIDTGISGVTAACVAEKLFQIGNFRQVICISHLPQIVSMADSHYLIEKATDGESTTTKIRKLDEEGSVRELARLSGGMTITEKTLENAKELKKIANDSKKKLQKQEK